MVSHQAFAFLGYSVLHFQVSLSQILYSLDRLVTLRQLWYLLVGLLPYHKFDNSIPWLENSNIFTREKYACIP
jgi:hypothetical protein